MDSTLEGHGIFAEQRLSVNGANLADGPGRPTPRLGREAEGDRDGRHREDVEVATVSPRVRFGLTWLRGFIAAVFVGYAGLSVAGWLGLSGRAPSMAPWLLTAVLSAGSLGCLLRAGVSRAQRLAWVVIGLALGSWACGAFVSVVVPSLQVGLVGLSAANAASLVFYPAVCVGVLLLLRATVPSFSALLWLDGLAGALSVSAIVAVVAFRPVLAGTSVDLVQSAAALSYPLADLSLIVVVVFSLSMTGWRPGSALGLVTGALCLIVVADGYSLWWTSTGHASPHTVLDGLRPLGVLLIAQAAAGAPIVTRHEPARPGLRSLFFPVAFSATALGLLLSGLVRSLNTAGYELATSALAFLVVRMVLTAVSNLQMSAASRREAMTDALTGLSNRRKLMEDLELAVTTSDPRSPTMLMLFDLDGFKLYNDTFGHPAGDALLARLGSALREKAQAWGHVYRLGGDEFCILCPRRPENATDVVGATVAALSERGQGFAVSASVGSVLIPTEAHEVTTALQLADQRLYQQKGKRRSGNETQQARDVLLAALRERDTGLPKHLGGVAKLAHSMACSLGLAAEEIDQITRAAELHDIGKMAIPESILDKPAALDDSEFELMRQHTIIGERILGAAPALKPVGALVRSSHEHYDGTGYPDRLAGQDIPLGARIILVCDAFDAMTSDRPYKAARSMSEAITELRRCAGQQFDPTIVDALCESLLTASPNEPQASPTAQSQTV